MQKIRIFQIFFSVFVVLSALPGAHRAAAHYDAYELIWVIPFAPAFTFTFFWIVLVMVGHFIAADSYKDTRAINQAKSFLVFFNWLFLMVGILFVAAGVVLYSYFSKVRSF